MRKIENRERNGKVHIVRRKEIDGTNWLLCGLVQQKPFKKAISYPCCYGEWQETDKPVTCKKCKKMNFNNVRRDCDQKMEVSGNTECARRRLIISGLDGCLCREDNCKKVNFGRTEATI